MGNRGSDGSWYDGLYSYLGVKVYSFEGSSSFGYEFFWGVGKYIYWHFASIYNYRPFSR